MLTKYTPILVFLLSGCASANDWGITPPWGEADTEPPQIQPYQLPTLNGNKESFHEEVPALVPEPKVNMDDIFYAVLRCYPEKSLFNIDVSLVAGVRSNLDQYNSDDWPGISEHYVGIIGRIPLYSATEQSRERQWEYQRRTATAKAVSTFVEALANRNYSYRLMGLYLSLEARTRVRVEQGIANVSEQVHYLEKVAAVHKDILEEEAKIVEQRLSLVAMCDKSNADLLDQYLQKLAFLPRKNDENKPHEMDKP